MAVAAMGCGQAIMEVRAGNPICDKKVRVEKVMVTQLVAWGEGRAGEALRLDETTQLCNTF